MSPDNQLPLPVFSTELNAVEEELAHQEHKPELLEDGACNSIFGATTIIPPYTGAHSSNAMLSALLNNAAFQSTNEDHNMDLYPPIPVFSGFGGSSLTDSCAILEHLQCKLDALQDEESLSGSDRICVDENPQLDVLSVESPSISTAANHEDGVDEKPKFIERNLHPRLGNLCNSSSLRPMSLEINSPLYGYLLNGDVPGRFSPTSTPNSPNTLASSKFNRLSLDQLQDARQELIMPYLGGLIPVSSSPRASRTSLSPTFVRESISSHNLDRAQDETQFPLPASCSQAVYDLEKKLCINLLTGTQGSVSSVDGFLCPDSKIIENHQNQASLVPSSSLLYDKPTAIGSIAANVQFTGMGNPPGHWSSLLHRPSEISMMQRSFSSHTLGQLRLDLAVPVVSKSSPACQNSSGLSNANRIAQHSELDMQGGTQKPTHASIRRVYSTGDIQVNHREAPDSSVCEDGGSKIGRYTSEERKLKIDRYRQKRTERNFNKKIKYACRKTLADSRPRIRGRFARTDDDGYSGKCIAAKHGEEDYEEGDTSIEEEELLLENISSDFPDILVMNGKQWC